MRRGARIRGIGPRVVLLRPRGGLNVGSVCRVIKNLAGGQLYVVDGDYDAEQARRLAVHGADVLNDAHHVPALADAVAGASLVVGTTARGGSYRARTRDVRELARELAAACVAAEDDGGLPPALVFGPEDHGLTNDDIALCHELAYVTTGPEYPSLNLSHAVALVLYEVLRARLDIHVARAEGLETGARVDAAELDAALKGLEDALIKVGFFGEETAGHMMQSLRALFGRARMDARDVRILRGISRQISWFAEGGHRVLAEKRSAEGERGET